MDLWFIKGTDGFSGAFAECLCGSPNLYQEGEFASISVKKLRKQQLRNFIFCLMVSQINYFRWDKKEESSKDLFRFCCLMTKFHRECESLCLDDFPTSKRLQWHGPAPKTPDWSETSRFVAFTLVDSMKGEIYVVFNANHAPVTVTLPDRPGYRLELLVDTGKPSPFDYLSSDVPQRDIAIKQYAHFLDSNLYPMLGYSSIAGSFSWEVSVEPTITKVG